MKHIVLLITLLSIAVSSFSQVEESKSQDSLVRANKVRIRYKYISKFDTSNLLFSIDSFDIKGNLVKSTYRIANNNLGSYSRFSPWYTIENMFNNKNQVIRSKSFANPTGEKPEEQSKLAEHPTGMIYNDKTYYPGFQFSPRLSIYEYDKNGQLNSWYIVDTLTKNKASKQKTVYVYNENKQLIKTEHRNADGQLLEEGNYSYNPLTITRKWFSPNGKLFITYIKEFEKDNILAKSIAHKGSLTKEDNQEVITEYKNEYNENGQLIKTISTRQQSVLSTTYQTTYTYYPNGLIKLSKSNKPQSRYKDYDYAWEYEFYQ